jgi:hypothetical protein
VGGGSAPAHIPHILSKELNNECSSQSLQRQPERLGRDGDHRLLRRNPDRSAFGRGTGRCYRCVRRCGAATNGVLTLTGTYNSTILANAIATMIAQGNGLRSALVSLGLIKGAA